MRTHSVSAAMALSEILSSALGIGSTSFALAWLMARIRRLSSGFPATTAAPTSPPLRINSRESRRSPDFCFLGPWHLKQLSASTGRTSFSKNSIWAAVGAGVVSAPFPSKGRSQRAMRAGRKGMLGKWNSQGGRMFLKGTGHQGDVKPGMHNKVRCLFFFQPKRKCSVSMPYPVL